MSRPLIVVAVAGLTISVVCLSLACPLTASLVPDFEGVLNRLSFDNHINVKIDGHNGGQVCSADSLKVDTSHIRRELTWSGDKTGLTLDVPAHIHYQPGGPRQFVVEGRADLLGHLQVKDGVISYDCSWSGDGKDMAPDITISGIVLDSFVVNGAAELTLDGVNQPNLSMAISGAGKVEGSGSTDNLDVTISGAGFVDLGKLTAKAADIRLSGAGDARLAVLDKAEVTISGIGQVQWVKRPTNVDSHVSGLGRVTDVSTP